ncbi:hypothetical protein [Flavisolibacter tropicus]|nr:hypothetical protein [Flavisolibacter tropicus]
MKRLLLAAIPVIALYACCKEVCEDQNLLVRTQNMQAVDTDTVFLIRYKPYSRFSEKIDTVKRYSLVPVGGTTQPSAFFDYLDFNYDWKIVIPALNKEYFISYIETEKKPCHCEGGKYRAVKRFELNNVKVEGSTVVLN